MNIFMLEDHKDRGFLENMLEDKVTNKNTYRICNMQQDTSMHTPCFLHYNMVENIIVTSKGIKNGTFLQVMHSSTCGKSQYILV